MATLPRSHSLSARPASVSTPHLAHSKERTRPRSLCEAAWGRALSPADRCPSQALHLTTTVPCSLVNKSLGGGRHHPTRVSLRHSRMVVMNRRGGPRWRPPGSAGLGRVGALVVGVQGALALLMGALAACCLLWAPNSVPFREAPHYPAVPMLLSCALGAVMMTRGRKRLAANCLKGLMVICSGVAVVMCLCVCVFTALHIVQLAPMRCREHQETRITPATEGARLETPWGLEDSFSNPSADIAPANGHITKRTGTNDIHGENASTLGDDEDSTFEGSGGVPLEYPADTSPERELSFNVPIHVQVVFCVCKGRNEHWTQTFQYPDLTCLEVNRVLPVLSVAICTVTGGGAILSGILIYLLWTSKQTVRRPKKSSERRPFIRSKGSLRASKQNKIQEKSQPLWSSSHNVNFTSTP